MKHEKSSCSFLFIFGSHPRFFLLVLFISCVIDAQSCYKKWEGQCLPTSMPCCLLTYCMAAVCKFVRRSHFLLHYSGWFTPEHYFEWVSGEGGGEGGGGDRVCPDAHPAVSLASSSVFCLFAKYFFWWMISRLICALQQAACKQGFRPLDMIDGGNTYSAVRI